MLDLTRLQPGGYCTLLLADLGADVIKVEEPGRGDYLRWTPPFVDGVSAAYRALNRGKRSITLNLKSPEGPGVLRRLAAKANVLVESFRPGVMDRLGVGPDVLREANPGLVYCAITGFGQVGPYRDRVGHDINYIGLAGFLELTCEPGGPPVLPAVQVADLAGAMSAAVGILAALVERQRTGRGRVVDTSMLDAAFSWLSMHAGVHLAGERYERGRMPLAGGNACYRVYRCADGKWVTVGALEPQFWRALVQALGAPELEEQQYAPDRQEEIAARLAAIFETKPRDEWLAELSDLEACVGPVNDLDEAFADPQIEHRRMVAEVDGAEVGPGSPFRFDGEQVSDPRPAPGFGEHTDEVLRWAGFPEAEVAALRESGAI